MKRETRGLILDSALVLFANKGYDGTTTEEIAKRAGVSKGLVFSYFKMKQDILFAVVDDGMRRVLAGLDPVPSALPPEARLERLIKTWVETIKRQPHYIRLLLQLHLRTDLSALLNERGIEFVNLYLGKLREVFKDLGSSDPDVDCYLLGAVMDGFSLNYSAAPGLFPLEELAKGVYARFVQKGKGT